MSYRCAKCNTVVGPNVTMRRVTEYRQKPTRDESGRDYVRREVAREYPVCEKCMPVSDTGIKLGGR